MYKQIIDAVNQGIVILSRDYKVLEWNRWMEIHSGISRNDIVNSSVFNHYPNLSNPGFTRSCKSVVNFGNFVFFSQKLHHFLFPFKAIGAYASKEEMMQQSCTMVPLRDEDGNINKIIITVQDVTESVFLENELRSMSQMDSLTGLFNRRYFDIRLAEEFNRCLRNKHDLSLILFDIDNFKMINDELGHQFGDLVLKEIAGACKAITRNCDILARFGGEEFCAILPESNADGAAAFAERIRVAVESLRVPKGDQHRSITVSLGVASMLQGADDTEILIKHADEAMYKSKHRGKNCVTVFTP